VAYNEGQRALAISIIERSGNEVTADVLHVVREALGTPDITAQTLRNWLKQKSQPKNFAHEKKENFAQIHVSDTVQSAAEVALDDLFETVARRYVQHALKDEVLKEMKGKDAVIAAATAVDKMRLLRDLPTEIIAVLPALVDAMERAGLKPSDVFNTMFQRLDAQARKVS